MVGGVANPSCSFRTVTRALQVGGRLRGGGHADRHRRAVRARRVPLDASETLPIIVPANVTITTQDGPIRVNLPASGDPNLANVAGFQLARRPARDRARSGGAVTIDGGSQHAPGIGIGVSPGAGKTASLSYVIVQNTGGHGIAVSNGTLAIGQGVTVTGAGTALKRRDGLNVAGGTVNIVVTAGQAPTAFNNNTQHGIYVTGAAVINIAGFPVTCRRPTGRGRSSRTATRSRACASSSRRARATFEHRSTAWSRGRTRRTGFASTAAGKVRVRNSVFLANVLNGVYITSYDTSAAGNDLSQLDLGTAADPGRNIMQAALGSNPNLAGLCVGMSPGLNMALTLSARGNIFAGPTDCATSTAALVRSTVCGGFADVGRGPERGHGGGDGRSLARPAAGTDCSRGARGNAPAEVTRFLAIRIPVP